MKFEMAFTLLDYLRYLETLPGKTELIRTFRMEQRKEIAYITKWMLKEPFILDVKETILNMDYVIHSGRISASESLAKLAAKDSEKAYAIRLSSVCSRRAIWTGMGKDSGLNIGDEEKAFYKCPLSPIWAGMLKTHADIPYSNWELRDKDARIAFGYDIFTGMTVYKDYATEYPDMVAKVKSNTASQKHDINEEEEVSTSVLKLPKNGYGGKRAGGIILPIRSVILQEGWAHRSVRNHIMITNYHNLDSYPE